MSQSFEQTGLPGVFVLLHRLVLLRASVPNNFFSGKSRIGCSSQGRPRSHSFHGAWHGRATRAENGTGHQPSDLSNGCGSAFQAVAPNNVCRFSNDRRKLAHPIASELAPGQGPWSLCRCDRHPVFTADMRDGWMGRITIAFFAGPSIDSGAAFVSVFLFGDPKINFGFRFGYPEQAKKGTLNKRRTHLLSLQLIGALFRNRLHVHLCHTRLDEGSKDPADYAGAAAGGDCGAATLARRRRWIRRAAESGEHMRTHIRTWLWVKNRYPKWNLVNGHMD